MTYRIGCAATALLPLTKTSSPGLVAALVTCIDGSATVFQAGRAIVWCATLGSSANSVEVWRIQESGDVTCPAGDTFKLSELRATAYYKQALPGYRQRALVDEHALEWLEERNGRPGQDDN